MTTKIKHIASNTITTTELDTSSLDGHFSGGTGVTYSAGAISIGQAVHSTDSPTFADLTITGNLNITGNIDQYNVTDLDVTDKTITLGSGQIEANSGGSGIIIDGSNASLLWNESSDRFDFNKNINVAGSILSSGQITTNSGGVNVNGGSGNAYVLIGSDTGSWTWKNYRATHKLALEDSDGTGEVLSFDTSGNATFAGNLSTGPGTQTGNGDANITIREGNAFAGFDFKSTRTSGNIGGTRFYNTSSDSVPKAQLLIEIDGSYNFYNGSNGAQNRVKIDADGKVGMRGE